MSTSTLPEGQRLTGISARAFEHPADRAATAALKRVPLLDTVVRKLIERTPEDPNGKTTVHAYDGLDRLDWKCTGGSLDKACTNGNLIERAYVGLEHRPSQEWDKDGKRRSYDYSADMELLGQDRFDVNKPAKEHSARQFSADANGSVEGLEDGSGTIKRSTAAGQNDAYDYDPYGASLNDQASFSEDATNNPFRFQGFALCPASRSLAQSLVGDLPAEPAPVPERQRVHGQRSPSSGRDEAQDRVERVAG